MVVVCGDTCKRVHFSFTDANKLPTDSSSHQFCPGLFKQAVEQGQTVCVHLPLATVG